jgi:hypothetical protein
VFTAVGDHLLGTQFAPQPHGDDRMNALAPFIAGQADHPALDTWGRGNGVKHR